MFHKCVCVCACIPRTCPLCSVMCVSWCSQWLTGEVSTAPPNSASSSGSPSHTCQSSWWATRATLSAPVKSAQMVGRDRDWRVNPSYMDVISLSSNLLPDVWLSSQSLTTMIRSTSLSGYLRSVQIISTHSSDNLLWPVTYGSNLNLSLVLTGPASFLCLYCYVVKGVGLFRPLWFDII